VAHRAQGSPFVAGWDTRAGSGLRTVGAPATLPRRLVNLVLAVEFELLALAAFFICLLVLAKVLVPAGLPPSQVFAGEKVFRRFSPHGG